MKMKPTTKITTTYKRKRDTEEGKNSSQTSTDKEDLKSSTESPSSPIAPLSRKSSTQDAASSSSSQSSSSQPSQSSQSSPPSTPTKKQKWDWWLKPKDNSQTKNAKSTPPKKSSGTPTKKKDSSKMQQMFLDLGQKNFDAKLCPECGMMYTPGVEEDTLMHSKFHAKHESIVNFPQWKSCRVVKEFASGGGVICVGQDDTIANQNKVAKVRKLMDKELGYVDAANMKIDADQKIFLYITSKNKVVGCVVAELIEEAYYVIIKEHSSQDKENEPKIQKNNSTDDLTSTPTKSTPPAPSTPSKSSSPSSSPSPSPSRRVTPSPKPPPKPIDDDDLDLDKIMEIDTSKKTKPKPIPKSHTKTEPSEGTPTKKTNNDNKVAEAMQKKFSVSCGKEPQKAVCGISRIWTARSHRRQGIATKLLDAVRANMVYGYTVPKELCAFSQPTADGKLFFEKYRGTKEFLVYL